MKEEKRMEIPEAANCLSQLGHETRLEIFQLLIRAGSQGLSVGDIGTRLELAGTTLNHHLSNLCRVGLVDKTRDGKMVWCKANYSRMTELVDFLKYDCCVDEKAAAMAVPATTSSSGCGTCG
jgi:ArsR family transcriptional regulator